MRFDSFVFPVFFVVFAIAYWVIGSRGARGRTWQNLLILMGSYFFYGWWDWRFLFLIALSTLVDYWVSARLHVTEEPRTRMRLLLISIGANLGVLGLFKYYDFFIDSIASALTSIGVQVDLPLLGIILPVGISFYTFQTLGYTVDVYRRRHPPASSLLSFACYVAFFPQLVAGPIERAERLLPQFDAPRPLSLDAWRSGCTLLVYGLVKKIAIADNMAPFADMVFSGNQASGPMVFAGTLAFAIQIYADFSGYSDIARGLARLLGFDLCVNFNKPYVSLTPSDFWQRWHISLSSWLRDYLYIPLGGNRRGSLFTYRNLMLTMALGGLWHGARGNFVLWGIYHGALLCLYRALSVDRWLNQQKMWLRAGVAAPIFFLFTLYGWMLFRAQSFGQIASFTGALLVGWSHWALAFPLVLVVLYYSAPIVVHHALSAGRVGEKWQPRNALLWRLSLAAIALYGILHGRASEAAFIYFQF